MPWVHWQATRRLPPSSSATCWWVRAERGSHCTHFDSFSPISDRAQEHISPLLSSPSRISSASSRSPPPRAPRRARAEPSPAVMPSLPMAQFGPQGPTRVALRADSETLAAGLQATLSATASSSVSGTNLAIEVFDETSHALVAACPRGSQCTVSYAAASGVHNFVAFVTPPTTQIPSGTIALSSNRVSVGWLSSGLSVSRNFAGQG